MVGGSGDGAGGGIGSADLELLAATLPELGTSVVRFEQPWRTAGRRVGAPPPRLDEAWIAALDWLQVRSGAGIHSLSAAVVPELGWPAAQSPRRDQQPLSA